MTLDAHQHFWRYNAVRDGWITGEMAAIRRNFLPEHLAPELNSNGVRGTVAVQADQSEEETRFLLDLAERNSFVRGVVGWVDLRSDRVAERLDFFSQFPRLRGFRHIVQAEPDDRFLLRPDFLHGIGSLAGFGFTYDLLVYPRQLPAAAELAAKFPAQKFVLDHIAKPPVKSHEIAGWERSLRQLAAHPNVSCKLSGLITEADWKRWRAADFKPYLDVVFDCFGSERMMFGSDWPVCLLAASYGQVKRLVADYTEALPEADRDKIFGLNAGRFYGLTT
jgi:L-fucono-1,5-lactonase